MYNYKMADLFKEIQENDLLKILLIVAGIYLFIQYTKKEESYTPVSDVPIRLDQDLSPSPVVTSAPIVQPPADVQTAAPVTDDSHIQEIVQGKPQLKTEDLLPKYDDASTFAKENPVSKLLKEQNFLISGYHVGVNTVVQSNKIPYHDLRSAPPIPKQTVGPWSQSSYETPMGSMRRQLEISN